MTGRVDAEFRKIIAPGLAGMEMPGTPIVLAVQADTVRALMLLAVSLIQDAQQQRLQELR